MSPAPHQAKNRDQWTPTAGVLLCLPLAAACVAVGSPSLLGTSSTSCQRCSMSPPPSHLFPWVLLLQHSRADPTQQLPRAMRESRLAWCWACPFTSDTTQLSGTASLPAGCGGRQERPGTGQRKDRSPHKLVPWDLEAVMSPPLQLGCPLSCRCLGGQRSLHGAAKGVMNGVKLPGHGRRYTYLLPVMLHPL